MPEYKYKCELCNEVWYTNLPMSHSVSEGIDCYIRDCDGTAHRKIGFRVPESRTQIVMKKGSTVGQWYKNQTGKDLLGE